MTARSPDALPPDVRPGRLSTAAIDAMLEQRLVANLATIGLDGEPNVVAMWFRREGQSILLPTSRFTRKARELRGHPRAAVMIDESRAGLNLRGIRVRGTVTLLDGPQARALNRSIHTRYITERGLRQSEVERYLTSGDDLTIVVAMEDVTSWNLAEGEAGRALARSGEVHPLDA
jgi:nitroimidazol reductase NimA-like FMN-containing flavoprotein (pyridoxamine 5'-phosphate oxidase superfamily)